MEMTTKTKICAKEYSYRTMCLQDCIVEKFGERVCELVDELVALCHYSTLLDLILSGLSHWDVKAEQDSSSLLGSMDDISFSEGSNSTLNDLNLWMACENLRGFF